MEKPGGPAMTLAKTALTHEHHEDDYLCCNYHYFHDHYHYILLYSSGTVLVIYCYRECHVVYSPAAKMRMKSTL